MISAPKSYFVERSSTKLPKLRLGTRNEKYTIDVVRYLTVFYAVFLIDVYIFTLNWVAIAFTS
jgi:hypothetical protein